MVFKVRALRNMASDEDVCPALSQAGAIDALAVVLREGNTEARANAAGVWRTLLPVNMVCPVRLRVRLV